MIFYTRTVMCWTQASFVLLELLSPFRFPWLYSGSDHTPRFQGTNQSNAHRSHSPAEFPNCCQSMIQHASGDLQEHQSFQASLPFRPKRDIMGHIKDLPRGLVRTAHAHEHNSRPWPQFEPRFGKEERETAQCEHLHQSRSVRGPAFRIELRATHTQSKPVRVHDRSSGPALRAHAPEEYRHIVLPCKPMLDTNERGLDRMQHLAQTRFLPWCGFRFCFPARPKPATKRRGLATASALA
mmetsp:Transcript_9816/g.16883  ORF Transcript_9816/g.16883 Transcript_9816/m.16883 type:complete len:239 (+) Transcript_9816:101-817(+)